MRFSIGGREVGDGCPCFVIGEAGINHQGRLDLAKRLVDAAAFAGVDAVKFQKRTIERLLSREALEAPYANENSFGRTYGEHRRALELDESAYRDLKAYADARSLPFFASAWDEEAADFLERLGVPAFKIPSACLDDLDLLDHVAQKGRPVILSTGMAGLEAVDRAYEAVRRRNPSVAILQCTSTYPAKFADLNLNVLRSFRERYPQAVIGYSGHELGIAVSAAAVALGAKILERHFTIDRTLPGSDHAASLEPGGLQKLVRDVRALEQALGSREKRPAESEAAVRKKLGKSLVAARALRAGQALGRGDLVAKCPGTGIPPSRRDAMVGRRLRRDLAADALVREEDLEPPGTA